jgi:uncharacterized protein (DUF488 family)
LFIRRPLARLAAEAAKRRVALMCAEKDPLECHRTILIAPHILAAGFDVQHIHADGSLESHADALGRLRRQLDLPEYDLFRTEDVIEDACRIQAGKIAFVADRARSGRRRMTIFTIGFTKKPAAVFFNCLKDARRLASH